jgi:hypothetical protein
MCPGGSANIRQGVLALELSLPGSTTASANPREILVAYDDLTASGREFGVPMPVMAQLEHDVHTFADQRCVWNGPPDHTPGSVPKT